VRIAAEAGYDAISFRLLPAGPGDRPPPLVEDNALVAEVMAAMGEAGLFFLDAEMIRIRPGGADLARYLPFLDRIAEMRARHINVVFDDADQARNVDTFGQVCELAAARGLTADLEFMPWTGVKTLAEARAIVEAAGHPAGAILFDCLHFDRCGATLEELATLPPALINYVQLCDGPEPWRNSDEELIRVARTARLIPGEGGIDVLAILRRLPPGLPVSVEVPNHAEVARTGAVALARRALEASKAMVGKIEAGR
jgi:sugar phosphate isomerase/epimerase